MNVYIFAIKNILDKLTKMCLEPKLVPFYFQTYILNNIIKSDPDIFIVSYPKCGRTWLRLLLKTYIRFVYNNETTSDEKSYVSIPHGQIIKFEHDKGSWVPAPPKLNNLNFNAEKYRNKDVVFLVRDPRDVIVSCWYHLKYRENIYQKDISNFIQDELIGIKRVIEFMNLWINNRDIPDRFMLLGYEQLTNNTFDALKELLEFLKIPIIDSYIMRTINECSFNKMKKMELNGKLKEPWMKPGKNGFKNSMKVRRGKIGGYTEVLSKHDIKFIDQSIKNNLSITLPYH